MPTPASRTPVRIARGTYANLLASIADLEEGEICFATDEDTLYTVESGVLVASGKRIKGDLRFGDSDNSNWVAFQAPSVVGSNITWTLPSADGTNGQVLGTNGSGTLSWITASGGASVTTSDTAPSTPVDGDLWYRSTDGRLYVYYDDGTTSQWVDAAPPASGGTGGASVTTSDTAPTSPADGDLWYDSVGGRTYVYYDDGTTSQWVDAAPQGGGSSTPTKIEVGNTKAEVTDTGSNGTFTVTTEGTGRLTVDSSGRTLLGGVTANSNGGVLQLSSGITFPATQVAASDANTLDDYEEGTFTPTIVGSTTAGTATYSAQHGRYTKCGNVVFVSMNLEYSGGSGSGNLQINGLPFTVADVNPSFEALTITTISNISLPASNLVFSYVNRNSTKVSFLTFPLGGGAQSDLAYDASGGIRISGSYFV